METETETETAMGTATVMETETETATATATAMETAMETETATVMGTAMETETETGTVMGTGTGRMSSHVRRLLRRVGVLAIATSLLAACAATSSEVRSTRVCPSLVAYGVEFRERAASEIDLLPDDSAIVEMLSDYSVMRDQVRACREMAGF